MSATAPAHRHGSHRSPRRHRLAVASRVFAALLGGYALATATTVALARVISAPRDELLQTAALPSFLVYVAAAVWAFSASTPTRAWLGIALPALVLALLAWLLRTSPAA